jgi:phosphoserine aminotransferase
MTRCYNFCAGPASLPQSVLEIARDDMLEWHDKGLSLMEMSHRSPEVVGVAQHAVFRGAIQSARRQARCGLREYWRMVQEGD